MSWQGRQSFDAEDSTCQSRLQKFSHCTLHPSIPSTSLFLSLYRHFKLSYSFSVHVAPSPYMIRPQFTP
jgi:hypothetical protein